MKCLACIPAIVLFTSLAIPLTAQVPAPAAPPPRPTAPPMHLSVWNPQGGSGCPVSMHASQIGGGTTVMVDSKGQKHPISRSLRLSLADPQHTATIVGAEITIHGLNGKPHSVESGSGPGGTALRFHMPGEDNPWEMTRNLTVRFGSGESGAGKDLSAETELAIAGFASVTWIRLDSLTFSDGTVWVPGPAAVCRTAPDPFMLISASAK